jgi:hypothetical protein
MVTMDVIMFEGMFRYFDVARQMWRNVYIMENGSGFEIVFEKRKNVQFRQGNEVMGAFSSLRVAYPMRLLMRLRRFITGSGDH